MKFQDLLQLYERKKKRYGRETFRYISQILKEAKELHKRDWLKILHPAKTTSNLGEHLKVKI